MRSRKRVWSWEHPEPHSEDRAREPGSRRVSSRDGRDRGTTSLVAKLVIAAFKLGIGDPNRDAGTQLAHPQIDTIPQIRTKLVRAVSESANPKFLRQAVLDAVDGVLETTVAMRVGCGVPRVVAFATSRRVPVTGTAGRGARLFALKTSGVLHVCMGGLELARPGRKGERAVETGKGWGRGWGVGGGSGTIGGCAI